MISMARKAREATQHHKSKKNVQQHHTKYNNQYNHIRQHNHVQNTSQFNIKIPNVCLLYTSPSPRDATLSRMPSSA